MSSDRADIQAVIWRYLKISISSCCRFVQKHPYACGATLLFFLLYSIIPSLYFYYILYSSPVIIAMIVSVQIYLRKEHTGIGSAVKADEKSPLSLKSSENGDVIVRRHGKPVIQSQMSRRRNFRDKSIEFDTEGGTREERGIVLATTRNDAFFLDREEIESLNHTDINSEEKNTLTSREIQSNDDLIGKPTSTEIVEVKEGNSSDQCGSNFDSVPSMSDKGNSFDQCGSNFNFVPSMADLLSDSATGEKSEKGNPSNGAETEVESSDDDDDDYDDEGKAQTDQNKAVEWTADDQQNLMDLGDSEVERNKRLESLIAKRRARKLFKMAIERSLMASGNASSSHIAPILIAKNNLLNCSHNSDEMESLQMPGSAPSVLLPARNPFDLPYDPLEEKPDLTADSFQQEFAAVNQKDIMFCRHESFCWGSSSSFDYSQDQQDSKFGPGLRRHLRYRSRSDMSDHDLLIDELMLQENDAMSHTVSTTNLIELGGEALKESANSVASKGKEEDKETPTHVTGTKADEIDNLNDTESRSADRSEILVETDSVKDLSTCSVASSEASDMSSLANMPIPIPAEGTVSNHPQKLSDRVRNSLMCSIPVPIPIPPYEMSPSNEKPKLEEFMFYRQKRGYCHTPAYSVASDLQVEVSELGSPTQNIEAGNISSADTESLTYDGDVEKEIASGSEETYGVSSGVEENDARSNECKVSDNVKRVVEEVHRFENSPDSLSPESSEMAIVSLKESISHHEPHLEKPKEIFDPRKKSKVDAKDNEHNLKPIDGENGQAEGPLGQEAFANLSQHYEKLTSESSNPNAMEKKTIEKIENVKSIKENPEIVDDEHKDIGSSSRSVEGEENLRPIGNSEQEGNILDFRGISRASQSFGSLSMAESMAESSSSSSPTSVLPGKIQPEQMPSSTSDVPVQNDFAPSLQDRVVNNSLGNTPPISTALEVTVIPPQGTVTQPQGTQDLAVETIDQPSTSSDLGKSKEAGDPLGKFTRETSLINNVNDPITNKNEEKEKLKSINEGELVTSITKESAGETREPEEAATLKSTKDVEENKSTKRDATIVGPSDLNDGIKDLKNPPKPYDFKGKLEVIDPTIQAAESNKPPVTSLQEENAAAPRKKCLPPLSTAIPKATPEDLFDKKKVGKPKKYPSEPSTPRGEKTAAEFADDHQVNKTLAKELSKKEFMLNHKGKEKIEDWLDEENFKESKRARLEQPISPKYMGESSEMNKVKELETSNLVPKSSVEIAVNENLPPKFLPQDSTDHGKQSLAKDPDKKETSIDQTCEIMDPKKPTTTEGKEIAANVATKTNNSDDQTNVFDPRKSNTSEEKESVAKDAKEKDSLVNLSNVGDPNKYTMAEAKEIVANDATKREKLINQTYVVDPKKSNTTEAKESVAKDVKEKESLVDQTNVLDSKNSSTTSEFDSTQKENEKLAEKMSNKENLIDKKNVADGPQSIVEPSNAQKSAKEVVATDKANAITTKYEETSKEKAGLKANEDTKVAANALNLDDVEATNKSANDSNAVETSKKLESEVKVENDSIIK